MARSGESPEGQRGPEGPESKIPSRGWGQDVRTAAQDVGSALQSSVAPVAKRVGAAFERGMTGVGQALEDPAAGVPGELLRQADLPELDSGNPLSSLAIRLDRESDLWRSVAMRQLARAAWMDRIAISTSVVSLVGVMVLAAIAAFRALFASGGGGLVGAGQGAGVALLLLVGALLVLLGSWRLTRAAGQIRAGQIAVAREALSRADVGELRLQRLAVLLETRGLDPEAYRAALRQLESEIRAT